MIEIIVGENSIQASLQVTATQEGIKNLSPENIELTKRILVEKIKHEVFKPIYAFCQSKENEINKEFTKFRKQLLRILDDVE